jgi:hypothetical protein
VSTESAPNKLPEEALIAFLDGIRAELSSPSDPVMLNQVRSFFRKHIPLHLRSYAAALLILRAAGMSTGQGGKTSPKTKLPLRTKKAELPRKQENSVQGQVNDQTRQSPGPAALKAKAEGMVPLFVSMGKRQRLRPQELRALIAEKTQLPQEELGRIHLFDNYSFIDVPEANADKIVTACAGIALKNRPLEIKPAKKKGESGKDSEG